MTNTVTVGRKGDELKKMALELSTPSPNRKMRKAMRSKRFYLTVRQNELASALRQDRQAKHEEFIREQTEEKSRLEARITEQAANGQAYLKDEELRGRVYAEAAEMNNEIDARRLAQIAEANSIRERAIAAQAEEAKILAASPKKMDGIHAEAQVIQDQILAAEVKRREDERLTKEQEKLKHRLYGQAMMMPNWRRGRWLRKKSAQHGISFN